MSQSHRFTPRITGGVSCRWCHGHALAPQHKVSVSAKALAETPQPQSIPVPPAAEPSSGTREGGATERPNADVAETAGEASSDSLSGTPTRGDDWTEAERRFADGDR